MRAVVDTVEAPATAPQQQRSTAAPPPGPVPRFTGVAELLTVTLLWGKRGCVVAWPMSCTDSHAAPIGKRRWASCVGLMRVLQALTTQHSR